MKRKLLIAVPLLCLVGITAWFFRPKHETLGEAFVGERTAVLWNSVAQVREPLDTLHYGDRVDVVGKRNDNVKVRTVSGELGWVESRYLIAPTLWERSVKLLKEVTPMPVQAVGRTKVPTNLRVAPGRTEARLYQFGRGVPVEVVGRAVADWVQVSDEHDTANDTPETKKEDWFLVRAVATRPPGESNSRASETTTTQPGDQTLPIAGWVIARFIELDLPDPIRDEASSANVRPIAWFQLNQIDDPVSGEKPQYLLAAARGPEGQPCDFTTIRVYTWNLRRERYETAFIENDLCGQLPVAIGKSDKGEPEFRFKEMDSQQPRVYRLIQTVVRRIRQPGEADKRTARRPKSIPAAK
ncbi:MAG TPA: SH3 domain-containing protein [Candidatus Acidoferrum sp.]|nr:SH3 domain-containing protein [Candidatus Acidoferrum sp.]